VSDQKKRDIQVSISGTRIEHGAQIAIGDGNVQTSQKESVPRVPVTALARALAELYPREPDQRRLVREADLAEGEILFDPAANVSWSNILAHATREGRAERLLAVAREEFPNDARLR
jgi:hypothetical protein